jgi:hypothetical protein
LFIANSKLLNNQSLAPLSAQSETDLMMTVLSKIPNSRAVLATAKASISAILAQVLSLNSLDFFGSSINWSHVTHIPFS